MRASAEDAGRGRGKEVRGCKKSVSSFLGHGRGYGRSFTI